MQKEARMAGYAKKKFDKPDEVRTFANGKLDVVNLASHVVARAAFEPGWKWSESIKPKVGTDSCQKNHSRTLTVRCARNPDQPSGLTMSV